MEVFSGERAGGTAGGGGGGWTNQFRRELQVCAINHRMRILRFVRGLATSKNRDFFSPPLPSLLLPLVFQPSYYNLSNDDRRVEREREREKGVSVKRRIKDEKRERERKRVKCAWRCAVHFKRTDWWANLQPMGSNPWTRLSDKARFSELLGYPLCKSSREICILSTGLL